MLGSRVTSHPFLILPQTFLAESRTLLRFSLLSALGHIAALTMLVTWTGGRALIQPPLQVITVELSQIEHPQPRTLPRVAEPQVQKQTRRILSHAQTRPTATLQPQPAAAVPTRSAATVTAKAGLVQGPSHGFAGGADAAVSAVAEPAPPGTAITTTPSISTVPHYVETSIRATDKATIRTGYLQRCRTLIERHKEYPVMARKGMIEGTVVIRGTLAQAGVLRQCIIFRSSGSGLLDNAALRAVRNVDRFPQLPSELQDSELVFELPISFRLSAE